MRKPIVILFLLGMVVLVSIQDASATPTRTNVCSSCHRMDSSVSVQATFQGCTDTTANYTVSVSNTYSGQEGWAVFDAGSNIQNAYGSSGSFSVPGGRSYEVWGVSAEPSTFYGTNYTSIFAECGGGSCTQTARIERNRLCFDGLDNDCDDLIDADDPSCAIEDCSNGTDDDDDGKIDCDDKKDCNKDPNCPKSHPRH